MQHIRIIPTLTHALLDHLIGLVLIVSPWVLDYHAARGAAVNVPLIAGLAVILNSLCSRSEMGICPVIGMRRHLWIDVVIGVVLAASPWLFQFADRIFWPHVIGGSVIALLPLFSTHKPFDESRYTEVVIRDGQAEIVRYARTDRPAIDPNEH